MVAPFDPGRFSDEAERSHTLPSRWYTDPAVFEREKERIFYREWWYAGATGDVAEPGAYLTTRVVDQEVVVVRGRDMGLRAFYNVCSHRAHRLFEGKGRKTVIVCPYHNWSYETDGAFKTGRGIEGLCDFDRKAASLKPVRVEVLAGLVFVNLDKDARPLAEVARNMAKDMADHCPGLGALKLAHQIEVETTANWKALVDNDLESYHVASAHPALYDLLDYSTFRLWEDAHTTSHAMANTKGENDAYRVSANDPVKDAIYTWLWPNTAFFISPGRNNLAVYQMVPVEAEKSLQRWDFYFEDSAPNADERAMLDYMRDVLIPEDTALCEAVQRGLRSRGYVQGRFVVNREKPEWSEHHLHMFQALVRDAVAGERSMGTQERHSP